MCRMRLSDSNQVSGVSILVYPFSVHVGREFERRCIRTVHPIRKSSPPRMSALPPGTLLLPQDLAVGALVQARDPHGLWYNARIAKKAGRGARAKVTVKYVGFSARHDEIFAAQHEAVRVRLPPAALKLERDAHL